MLRDISQISGKRASGALPYTALCNQLRKNDAPKRKNKLCARKINAGKGGKIPPLPAFIGLKLYQCFESHSSAFALLMDLIDSVG